MEQETMENPEKVREGTIIGITIDNFKNLKAVRLVTNGASVVLNGKNGAGKSSILDAIFCALTGKRILNPIREGESKAEIQVELEKAIVRRIITEKTNRLEIKSKDGNSAYASPQALLDQILGDLTFDPLKFTRVKPAEQCEILTDLAGIDTDDLAKARDELYYERKACGQIRDQRKSQLDAIGEPPKLDHPQEPVSASKLLDEIRDMEKQFNRRRTIESLITSNDNRICSLHDQIKLIRQQITELENKNVEIGNEYDNIPEITQDQLDQKRQMLQNVEDTNRLIREANEYNAVKDAFKRADDDYNRLTQAIADIDRQRMDMIENAAYPVDGLSVNIETKTVLYNGIPFENLSSGQQIKISTVIAMKLNPKLKVILIREGSLLDNESMQAVIDMAEREGYQLWIERVGTGDVGILIEDGGIVER